MSSVPLGPSSEARRAGRTARPAYSVTPVLTVAASLVFLGLVWHAAATVWPSRAFPPPLDVLRVMALEVGNGEIPYHLGITLCRVVASFALAMIIGSAIGIFLGSHPRADRVVDPWVILSLNVPALVIIVLAYIWFGLTEAAAIGAVAFNKIPNVIVTMREGARALDPRYAEMAQIYRFGALDRLRHILLPQLQPYLAAASRTGISLIWKIVLVVELLGRSNGVGFQINLYFQLFDVASILSYTLAFACVMLIVEFLLVQPLEHSSTRWRRRPA